MAGSQEWIGNVHGSAYGSGLWCKHKCLSPRNLRRLRVARGRSQEDLALDAEVDRTYMSRLERARVNPSVGVLEQIAGALDAHISEFFIEPAKGELPPKPLRGGRRRRV